jgi:hypothetical protein
MALCPGDAASMGSHYCLAVPFFKNMTRTAHRRR